MRLPPRMSVKCGFETPIAAVIAGRVAYPFAFFPVDDLVLLDNTTPVR